MDEPRYTREEWAVIDWQEREASLKRATEQGFGSVGIPIDARALRGLPPQVREELIDAKLEQARISILKMIEEQAGG